MSEVVLRAGGVAARYEVSRDGDAWTVRVGPRTHRLRLTLLESGVALVESDGRTHLLHAAAAGGRTFVHLDGVTLDFEPVRRGGERGGGATDDTGDLRAPMPGVVTQVLVRVGDTVRTGQPLLIVEAMKMEHVVRAGGPGVVRAVRVAAGDQVDGGAVVAELAPVMPGDTP
ncbi:MAG TPA: biotin/lipoyl-containing protein [bacterium]|nr:biotin/lipoyl-containing protein [bacterium]